MLIALWNGLKWMQRVLSASTIFSREMNRFNGSIGTCRLALYTLAVCTEMPRHKEQSFSNSYWHWTTAVNWTSFCVFPAIWGCLDSFCFVCAVSCLCENGGNHVNLFPSFVWGNQLFCIFKYSCCWYEVVKCISVCGVIRLFLHFAILTWTDLG